MELFQLRSFVKVAELGSVTRAAEELYLTQPAVTQHIKSLERELDTVLFDRTGRGLRLTEAGRMLHEHANRGLRVLEESAQAMADLREGVSGRLSIGAGVTTSIFYLPERLRAFRDERPLVDVVVRTGRSREVAAMVLEHRVDLGIVTSSVEHPALVTQELFEEGIVLVVAPDDHSDDRIIHASELAQMPLILFPSDTGFRQYLEGALAGAGVTAKVKMETDSVEAIKSFVAAKLGASLLPESAVSAEIASGELARVRIQGIGELRRRTSLIRRSDHYLSAAADKFIDTLCGYPSGHE